MTQWRYVRPFDWLPPVAAMQEKSAPPLTQSTGGREGRKEREAYRYCLGLPVRLRARRACYLRRKHWGHGDTGLIGPACRATFPPAPWPPCPRVPPVSVADTQCRRRPLPNSTRAASAGTQTCPAPPTPEHLSIWMPKAAPFLRSPPPPVLRPCVSAAGPRRRRRLPLENILRDLRVFLWPFVSKP